MVDLSEFSPLDLSVVVLAVKHWQIWDRVMLPDVFGLVQPVHEHFAVEREDIVLVVVPLHVVVVVGEVSRPDIVDIPDVAVYLLIYPDYLLFFSVEDPLAPGFELTHRVHRLDCLDLRKRLFLFGVLH